MATRIDFGMTKTYAIHWLHGFPVCMGVDRNVTATEGTGQRFPRMLGGSQTTGDPRL